MEKREERFFRMLNMINNKYLKFNSLKNMQMINQILLKLMIKQFSDIYMQLNLFFKNVLTKLRYIQNGIMILKFKNLIK